MLDHEPEQNGAADGQQRLFSNRRIRERERLRSRSSSHQSQSSSGNVTPTLAFEELAEHELQDAAVLVIRELDGRIDTGARLELLDRTVGGRCFDLQHFAWSEASGNA